MPYRQVLLCLIVSVGCVCQAAEEWSSRFDRARRLAFKRAGPEIQGMASHHIIPSRVVLLPAARPDVVNPVPIQRRRDVRPHKIRMREAPVGNVRPPRSAPPRVEEIIRKARSARNSGQLEQALRLYRMALTVKPESAEATEQIGEIEREMN